MRLSHLYSEESRPYTGPELRPHFLLQTFRLQGSALVAFVGPCQVNTEHLVDWEDRLASDSIRSKLMLHFLGEFFGISLESGVLYQRLFISIVAEELRQITGKEILREGDDLFWDDRKLSVSIVTSSPVSQLFHAGVNLDATGAPVAAAGLFDLGLGRHDAPQNREQVQKFALRVLERFSQEVTGIEWACAKVRPVV